MENNSDGSAVDENCDSATRGRVNPSARDGNSANQRLNPNNTEQRDNNDSSCGEEAADESSKELSEDEEEAKKEEEAAAPSSFKPLASHSRKSLLSTLTRHVHTQYYICVYTFVYDIPNYCIVHICVTHMTDTISSRFDRNQPRFLSCRRQGESQDSDSSLHQNQNEALQVRVPSSSTL